VFLSQLKNKNARTKLPLGIVKPKTIEQVQECAKWAFQHNIPISVIGGGHSEHCTNSSAFVVSMENFSDITV
jgi:FAD/FMN-containing dehydrogenase